MSDNIETLLVEREEKFIKAEFVRGSMSGNLSYFFSDIITVKYKGQEYDLRWNEFESDYRGIVDGRSVILL